MLTIRKIFLHFWKRILLLEALPEELEQKVEEAPADHRASEA